MGMRIWLAILAGGCAGTAANGARSTPVEPHAAAPATPPTGPFVERAPGPIGGSYRVTCPENNGEIIEFTVDRNRAVGRVVDPGAAKRFGFQKGEEIFRLTADSYGDW